VAIFVQLSTSIALYEVRFKMFSVIKFFFIPIAILFALSLFVVMIRLSKPLLVTP